MTTIETLSVSELSQKLSDPDFQDAIDFDIDMVLSENAPGSSLVLLRKLESAMKQAKLPPDLSAKYNKVLIQLKSSAFSKLTPQEGSELISKHLLASLKSDLDLSQHIRSLFLYPDASDFKKVDLLLRGLEANNELLVNNIISNDGKQYAGTIGNIIRLYKSSPDFTTGGSLGVANFLTNNKNIKLLDKEAIEILREVLSIYEWIRLNAVPKESLIKNNVEIPREIPRTVSPKPAIPQKPAPELQISKPVAPAPPKLTSDFDKKLASMAAPTSHGQDLEVIRKQMERKASPAPKPPIAPPKINPQGNKMTPDEIKREVSTEELPPHREPANVFKPQASPAAPEPAAPKPVVRPVDETPYHAAGELETELRSLDQVSTIDDLKKVNLSNLREGPVDVQTETLKSKILSLANANKLLPFYAVSAFEQSPLFRSYLQVGSAMIADSNSDRITAFKDAAARIGSQLTLQEFEAIADLKKEIERL